MSAFEINCIWAKLEQLEKDIKRAFVLLEEVKTSLEGHSADYVHTEPRVDPGDLNVWEEAVRPAPLKKP